MEPERFPVGSDSQGETWERVEVIQLKMGADVEIKKESSGNDNRRTCTVNKEVAHCNAEGLKDWLTSRTAKKYLSFLILRQKTYLCNVTCIF